MPDVPKNAKKPQDRKPKDESAAAKAEATGDPIAVTLLGLDIKIDREVADDYEVLELIGEADENPGKMTGVFRLMLGAEQYARLKEAARGENGRVSSDKMLEAFDSLWEQLGNSPASSGS